MKEGEKSSEKLDFIKHYQNSIVKSSNDPDRILHCLKKLENVPITVQDLQETGVGKTVNALRKLDGEAGELASSLVTKWKDQISKMSDDEPMTSPTAVVSPREQPSHVSVKHSSSPNGKVSHSSSSHSNGESSKKSKSHHHHHTSSSSSNHHSSSKHKSSKHRHRSKERDEKHERKESKEQEGSSEGSSSGSKHHSSSKTHHSSSSHKSSHKRNRDEAETKENDSKAKKPKVVVEVKEREKEKETKSNGTTSSNSNNKESDKKKESQKTATKRKQESGPKEFDGAQGMGFAEALAAFDMPTSSKQQKKTDLADKITSVKKSSSSGGSSSSKSKSKSSHSSSSSSHKHDKEKSRDKDRARDKEKSSSSHHTSSSDKKPLKKLTEPPKLLTEAPKSAALLPDIVSGLPNDISIPEYRPVPMNSAMKDVIHGSSSQSRHEKSLTEGELLAQSFSSKSNRMKIYSGKSSGPKQVPRLTTLCLDVVKINIDGLESTGGVPFDVIQPALVGIRPEQLAAIEYYNPYYLEDTDELWKTYCQRKWRNIVPGEMETWRELYERREREDKEKLDRLTQNIQKKQVLTSNGVQKTKMAFVDMSSKAPRGTIRRSENFGKKVVIPLTRCDAPKKLPTNQGSSSDVLSRVASGLRVDSQQIASRASTSHPVKKAAPLMSKCLSLMKR